MNAGEMAAMVEVFDGLDLEAIIYRQRWVWVWVWVDNYRNIMVNYFLCVWINLSDIFFFFFKT